MYVKSVCSGNSGTYVRTRGEIYSSRHLITEITHHARETINLLRQLLNSNLGASIIIGEWNQPVLYPRHDVTRYRLLQSLFIVTLLQHCMEVRQQTDDFRDRRRQTSRSYMSGLAASAETVNPCS